MPSAEFARIIKDLAVIGESCTIACDKHGVRFSVSGALGTGNVMVRNNASVDKEEVSRCHMAVTVFRSSSSHVLREAIGWKPSVW